MSQTLNYLLGKRMWWISGVNVWGELAAFTPEFIISEATAGGFRILHASYQLGGETQVVRYVDLVDIKGNRLPAMLKHPRVLPASKGNAAAVIQGEEGTESFKIAKLESASTPGSVTVDLLVIEMGD